MMKIKMITQEKINELLENYKYFIYSVINKDGEYEIFFNTLVFPKYYMKGKLVPISAINITENIFIATNKFEKKGANAEYYKIDNIIFLNKEENKIKEKSKQDSIVFYDKNFKFINTLKKFYIRTTKEANKMTFIFELCS